MISSRELTAKERSVLYPLLNGNTPESVSIPAWGKIYLTTLGNVLLFDGADGRRRFLLLSGPIAEVSAVVQRVNLPPYLSPDAGLLALLNDLARRAVSTGQTLVSMGLLVLFVLAITKVTR